jgi:hypothetical protein
VMSAEPESAQPGPEPDAEPSAQTLGGALT